MTARRNELKAGLFIVVTIVLAAMIIIWIRGASVGPEQNRTIAFKLTDDLGGLQIGDDVRLGGFKVGIVHDIRLTDLEGPEPHVLVTITIPASYQLHRNAIAMVQNGLTGTTNLNIQSLGTGEVLTDGVTLTGQTDPKTALFAAIGRVAPHLESALAQIDTKTVPKINQTVDTVDALIAHADSRVDPIINRYNKVVDGADVAIGKVDSLLGDTTPDIRGTLKNLNGATGTLKEKLPGFVDRLNATLATAQGALLDVQKTAANAKDITASLRSVIVDNQGKLDGIITGLKSTSDNLKEASIELRHSPWRLLYKPTPEEAGNLNVYDSAREFAQGAGSLSDAATALRDAMHDPNADRAELQKRINDLNASFSHFQQVESKLWSTAKP